MSHHFGRSLLIGPLVICAAALGPVAAAHASDASLRATVKSDVPAITRSQAKITAGQAALKKTHSITKLIKAVKAQDTNLIRLRTRVQGESSSTPTGAKGKADVVMGLELIVTSNRALNKFIEQESLGIKVSKARLNVSVRDDKRGNALFVAGAKLLGV
jgi:hypothetical protein